MTTYEDIEKAVRRSGDGPWSKFLHDKERFIEDYVNNVKPNRREAYNEWKRHVWLSGHGSQSASRSGSLLHNSLRQVKDER